ncbi:MAG: alanine dehydrogenase [Rhodospirillaceae bacterium]
MKIGIPKEIKVQESRVGMTPAGVAELVHHGHQVMVQTNAGLGIGADDDSYRQAGALIGEDLAEVYGYGSLIVKVKEPLPEECALLRADQTLFAYLHLAAEPDLARSLAEIGCTAIAYETVTAVHGGLPLLAPMSLVAGRMSIQAGAHCLERESGGRGVLLSGVPGVEPAQVVILGGGVVGSNAARVAHGMGADVVVFDRDIERLRLLDERYGGQVKTRYATRAGIEAAVLEADLVIGGVLIPGDAAPKLVSDALVRAMRRGSVLVDVAIDQGGCFETSRPTNHAEPTYIEHGVVHYCVTNMPGAVARTSTHALTNATLPFVLDLAEKEPRYALAEDPHLLAGLNVLGGQITHKGVAHGLHLPFIPPEQALGL